MTQNNDDVKRESQAGTPVQSEDVRAEETKLTVDLERYAAPEIEDDDEDDAPTEWVPTRFEKKIKAIPDKQWNLYQTLAGVVIGAATAGTLFLGGSGSKGSSIPFLIAVVVALAGPNVLEDRGRRKLNRFRMVLIIVMAVSIIAFTIYNGTTKGWDFMKKKEETEAALRLAGLWRA